MGRLQELTPKQKKKEEKATISHVAELAGVSPGTASRALNSVGYISKSTREKVMKAANDLD